MTQSNIILEVLQTSNTNTSQGRICDKEVYNKIIEKWKNSKKVKQREENIDSLLEDREAENVDVTLGELHHPVSKRSYGEIQDGIVENLELKGNTLIGDIVIHPTNSVDYIKNDITILPSSDIGISSRGFTQSK